MSQTDPTGCVSHTEPPWGARSILFGSLPMVVAQDSAGAPLFVAEEIGHALGYFGGGRKLRDLISDKWSDRLRPGKDVVKLSGGELAPLKASGAVAANTSSLVLLTESGLYRVLMLSGKPAALRLQEWLADEVLPAIRRTGRYEAPPVSVTAGEYARRAADAGDWRRCATFTRLQIEQRRREDRQKLREQKLAFAWAKLRHECGE